MTSCKRHTDVFNQWTWLDLCPEECKEEMNIYRILKCADRNSACSYWQYNSRFIRNLAHHTGVNKPCYFDWKKKIKNKVCRNILKRSPYSLLTKVCFDSDSSSQLIHIPEFGYWPLKERSNIYIWSKDNNRQGLSFLGTGLCICVASWSLGVEETVPVGDTDWFKYTHTKREPETWQKRRKCCQIAMWRGRKISTVGSHYVRNNPRPIFSLILWVR